MALVRFVVIASVLVACGARTGLDGIEARAGVDAGRDAGILDAALDAPRSIDASIPDDVVFTDAGDPCEIGPDPLREPVCTRPLFAGTPSLSCPGGFVDVAAQGEGTLAWECDGVRAEARFGARSYRGTRSGDRVSLCIRTEFDYVDGCRWQTSQRIEGDVNESTLALTYREVAISGMSCFPPCTADATIELR